METANISQSTSVSGTPDDLGRLAAALSAAQAEFEAPKKIKRGQQGNRTFQYAPPEEVIRATRPAMSKHKLAIVNYLEPVATTLFVTSELRLAGCGAVISSRFPLTPGLSTQDRGKEITYGKRYNRCALLDVAGEDADADEGMDGTAGTEAELQAEQEKKAAAGLKLEALKAAAREGRLKSAHDGRTLQPGEDPAPGNDAQKSTTKNTKEEKAEREEQRAGPLAGIAPALARLMQRDGIAREEVTAYAVRHLAREVDPADFDAGYLAGLTKEGNWKKAVEAMIRLRQEASASANREGAK